MNDIITEKNYTFYINVYAKGGNKIRVGPLQIMIGCHPDIPIIYEGVPELNKTYPLRTDRDKIRLSFSVDGIRSANPYCKIFNYELISSDNKPDPLIQQGPFQKPNDVYMFQNCTSPPCTLIEFTQHYTVIH